MLERSKTPGERRRVLVVEEDGSYRWVIRRLLESAFGDDVTVEEVATGRQALERLESDPPLDLILLDLWLPEVSGFEILRRMRAAERTRRIPVIVVSSSQGERDVQRAYALGANSFISKSDPPEKTLHRLRLLPVYWLELNRLPEKAPPRPARSRSRRSSTPSATP